MSTKPTRGCSRSPPPDVMNLVGWHRSGIWQYFPTSSILSHRTIMTLKPRRAHHPFRVMRRGLAWFSLRA
jgi:hypothetical protein